MIVEIEIHGDDVPCHRCGRPLLLAARVPQSFTRVDGRAVNGYRTVPLCPRCDRDDSAAQGVLAYFALYQTITDDTVDSAGAVLREWINHMTARPPIYTETGQQPDRRNTGERQAVAVSAVS